MKKWMIYLCLWGLIMTLFSGCQINSGKVEAQLEETDQQVEAIPETTPVTSKNSITIPMNSPSTLNPLYNTDASVQQALYLIFSPLVNIEADGSLSSNLAQSWVVNDTNTAVTVTLYPNIYWHDGTPLTSEDVLYTLEAIKSIPDSSYAQAAANILSTEKMDDTTFKIVYKESFSGVLQTLFFPVIPKHIYEGVEAGTTVTPVGSGPYIYETTVPLQSISLKANTSYFKGSPLIEKVILSIIPDDSSSLYAFKQGLVDVVYTDATEWGKYTSEGASTAYLMDSPTYEFMGLNLNRAIFQNASIRKALLYALNRQEMVHLYYLDHAMVTDTPISPASYLFDKGLEIEAYDKEKAKLIFTQEGYEKNKTTGLLTKAEVPFSFTLLVNQENADRQKVAGEIKRMYEDIGIGVTIEVVDRATYFERITTGAFDAFLGGFKLSYATDLSFALHSSSVLNGQNYVGYQDDAMNQLLQQAFLATPDMVGTAYQALQKYFKEQVPYVSLYFKKSVFITKNHIKGVVEPTPLNIFASVEKWDLQ